MAEAEVKEECVNDSGSEPEAEFVQRSRQSDVYSATAETLFSKKMTQTRTHALSLVWMFGRNPELPLFILQDHDDLVVLYAGAHVGVIYNHTSNSQHLLQGHSHNISCICVSEDRRWIATADTGLKSTVMIWDSYSGIPVHTMFDCHPKRGVVAIAFSSDTKHLVTLGAEEVQHVCIWDWTDKTEKPLWSTELHPDSGFHDYIIFNPNDSSQLLSTSESQVLFYSTAQGILQQYALQLNQLNDAAGSEYDADMIARPSPEPTAAVSMCGHSVFHWRAPQVVTVTARGSFLVWNVMTDIAADQDVPERRFWVYKPHRVPKQITAFTVADSCFVTGDSQGHITFYNELFTILTVYSDLHLDAIVSITFSKDCTEGYLEEYTPRPTPFIFRNLVVSTHSSKVVHVNAQNCSTLLLLDEDSEHVHVVACHPKQPVVAIGNDGGVLKVWDYDSKVIICSRVFETEMHIQSLSFDPQGSYLAVGFSSGAVHILNPKTLQSVPEECFHFSKAGIHHITFSTDSKYFATADDGNAVTVFRLWPNEGLPRWTHLGRYQSHYKPIVDLLFGVHLDSHIPRLLSLGMDRRLVEYDLENSDIDDLHILSSERIEQSAVPTCMTWYPPLSAEQFLLVASDQYKMKLFNSTTKMCRKTLLGPTYDSPIRKVVVLAGSKVNSYYLAFITKDKLGLQILPLDGNPYKSNALICHPKGASALTCSYDGRFIFTAGGSDSTVLSWEININGLEAAAALGGKDMEPFYSLLEGGRDGKFFREMEEFFLYCQIRHQGIDSMEKRQVSNKIPVSEVPSLMRALGCFHTEQEIEDMQNEVKFSKYEETAKYVTDIDLEEFIKLYVNHRPTFGISIDELTQAFQVLSGGDHKSQPALQRHELLDVLQARGEHMTEEELADCFTTLLGLNEDEEEEEEEEEEGGEEYSLQCAIPEAISLQTFTDHILGFPTSAEQRSLFPPPK